MTGRFPYGKLAKYPHMKPRDIALWERFIVKHPDFFDTVDYDVNVGKGADFDTSAGGALSGDVNALYKLKIDVVGYNTGEIWVVEIRPNAGVRGIADAAVYDDFYRVERKPAERVVAALLTDRITPDMERLAEDWEVEILSV